MRNKLFSYILILLLLLGCSLLIMPQKDMSSLENRPLAKTDTHLLKGDVESILLDQFPFRDNILQVIYKARYFGNSLFGSNEVDGLSFNYLNDDVIQVNEEYLIGNVVEFDQNLYDYVQKRGYNTNSIDLRYPDIKTYVYLPTRFEEIAYSSDGLFDNYLPEYRDAFLSQLNKNIKVKTLDIQSFDDYKNYYYKTDYHWNYIGAYQGYNDIIHMIQEDYQIEDVKPFDYELIYGHPFNGNLGSQVGKITESEHLTDYYISNTDDYVLMINDEQEPNYELKLRKEYYADHGHEIEMSGYDYYFGDNQYKRIFTYYGNEDKPNILIFGDSFINPIQTWLASHFNKTVILDMRSAPEDFDLDKIIEENEIDIILISQMYKNLYFNGDMFVPLNE